MSRAACALLAFVALAVLWSAPATAQGESENDRCWNAFDESTKLSNAAIDEKKRELAEQDRTLRDKANALLRDCSRDDSEVRLYEAWWGTDEAAPASYDEGDLALHPRQLAGGGSLTYDSEISKPLGEAVRSCGCEVVTLPAPAVEGQAAHSVTRVHCPVACTECVEPGYDRAAYEQQLACLKGAIDAVEKERQSWERKLGGGSNPRMDAYLLRQSAWENLFGGGVKLPPYAFVPGTGVDVAALDVTAFLLDISTALVRDNLSVDAAISAAVNKHSHGQAQAQEALRQLGNAAKQQYRAALAKAGWTAEQVEVLMSGTLGAADLRIAAGREDLQARRAYLDLRRHILERAVIGIKRARCDCLHRYVDECLRAQRERARALANLYEGYRQARDHPGAAERYDVPLLPRTCEAAREVLAHPGDYPAGLVAFARCFVRENCPEPTPEEGSTGSGQAPGGGTGGGAREKGARPGNAPPEQGSSGGSPGRVTEEGGLREVAFDTASGRLTVYLPDDITAGDTLSGTVSAEPSGESEAERVAHGDELRGMVVEVDGKGASAGAPVLRWAVSGAAAGLRVRLMDPTGAEIGHAELPLAPTGAAPATSEMTVPEIGQSGRPVAVRGTFDGDLATSKVQIKGQDVVLLAESPRQLIFAPPPAPLGLTTLRVTEGGIVTVGAFRNVAVRLSAERTHLERGQRTTLTLRVEGLAGLTAPLPIRLVNHSPAVVTTEGGEEQTITLQPSQVDKAGGVTLKRRLTGAGPGAFDISARLDRR